MAIRHTIIEDFVAMSIMHQLVDSLLVYIKDQLFLDILQKQAVDPSTQLREVWYHTSGMCIAQWYEHKNVLIKFQWIAKDLVGKVRHKYKATHELLAAKEAQKNLIDQMMSSQRPQSRNLDLAVWSLWIEGR